LIVWFALTVVDYLRFSFKCVLKSLLEGFVLLGLNECDCVQKLVRKTAGREFDFGRDTFDSAPSFEFVVEWVSRRYSQVVGKHRKLENPVSRRYY